MDDVPLIEMSAVELVHLRHRINAELDGRDVCEHGIQTGEFCDECSVEYKRALAATADPDELEDDEIPFETPGR